MGYTIEYGPSGKLEALWHSKRKKRNRKMVSMVVLSILILTLFLSGRLKTVWDFMIPGNPEITKAAFGQFVDDISHGNPFSDAIYTFCREIIDHAEIPE